LSKQKKRVEADAIIAMLAERFPSAFTVSKQRRRPLKLRIDVDLMAAIDGLITPQALNNALGYYVGSPAYLERVVTGASRYDLTGTPVDMVTTQEELHARERLAQYKRSVLGQQMPSSTPTAPDGRKRLGLADLRAAGRRRRGVTQQLAS